MNIAISAAADSAPRDPVNSGATRYLTSAQVGDLLQVSSRTVQRWALQDSTMPATRVGRVVRFPASELERWLERSTQGQRKGRVSTGK